MEVLEQKSEYEIQRGKPMPSKNQAILQKRLIVYLSNHYDDKMEVLSEVSLNLQDWISTPDLAIYPKMEVNFAEDEIRLEEAPLAVIEILSPTQSLQGLSDKAVEYLNRKVQSVWLVLPSLQSITVYQSEKDFTVFTAPTTLEDEKLNIQLELKEVFK